jgi:predicted DNA-binding ribbon-helix-helix protein
MMRHLQQHTRNQPLYLRDGSYTSVRLEPIFFHALRLIAHNRGLSMSDLIREIEGYPRNPRRSFTSALRCYVVEQLGSPVGQGNEAGVQQHAKTANRPMPGIARERDLIL